MVNPKGERIPEGDCDNFPVRVDIHDVKKAILKSPTIDPVVHGEWINGEDDGLNTCSVCKEYSEYATRFCCNCGAKMDGEK